LKLHCDVDDCNCQKHLDDDGDDDDDDDVRNCDETGCDADAQPTKHRN